MPTYRFSQCADICKLMWLALLSTSANHWSVLVDSTGDWNLQDWKMTD